MAHIASIVRAVRTATTDNEEFDLAGAVTAEQAAHLIRSAFGEPLTEAQKPLKFTFLVGGGKGVRTRYDLDLPKWLTAELRAIGYDDDRSAAQGSTGAYKRQHDVDANLEYLHVFPRLAAKATPGGGSGGAGAGAESTAAPAVDRESPAYVVTACTLAQLQRLVPSRVVSYSQKKRLLGVLQDADRRLEALDNKMMTTAQPLSPGEQEEYDVTTREALAEKVAWVQAEIKAQVAAGKLTAAEKEHVLAGMDDKLAAAKAELAAAAASNPKKAAALQAGLDGLAARRSALAAAPPVTHAVRGDADMRKAVLGMQSADKLRARIAKEGRLATIPEARELGARVDHEERLAALKAEARGWFEEDAEFDARVDAALKALAARATGRR